MRSLHAAPVALALVFVATGAVEAQMPHGQHGSLEQIVVGVDTPQAHEALASYYRGKAEEMRQMAAGHRSMSKAYSGTKLAQRQQMQQHCEDLATTADKAAADYDALAKEEAAAAKR